MNITKEDEERLQSKYDLFVNKLAKQPPSFIRTGEQLHQFALNLTALHEATQKAMRFVITKRLISALEKVIGYRDCGYPFGKTRRGLKKWLKQYAK